MTDFPPNKSPSPISDAHLRAIGAICVNWSVIEMGMELAILCLYDIDRDRGLPLTSNIGYQSRLALLRILATQGAITDPIEAKACTDILTRIEQAYPKRNEAAHGLWKATKVPQVARRLSIRAKGNRLRCTNEPVAAAELEQTASMLLDLNADFLALMKRLGFNAA
jgi:hypothetical protein